MENSAIFLLLPFYCLLSAPSFSRSAIITVASNRIPKKKRNVLKKSSIRNGRVFKYLLLRHGVLYFRIWSDVWTDIWQMFSCHRMPNVLTGKSPWEASVCNSDGGFKIQRFPFFFGFFCFLNEMTPFLFFGSSLFRNWEEFVYLHLFGSKEGKTYVSGCQLRIYYRQAVWIRLLLTQSDAGFFFY